MWIYRTLLFGVFWLLLAAAGAHAQGQSDRRLFEFTGLGGIQFGGSPDLEEAKGSFDWGPSFGGIASFRVSDEGLVGVSYTRQRTEFDVKSTVGAWTGKRVVDADVGYLHFGGELELPLKAHLIPFIGLSVGTTHFTPRDGGATDWFFSAAFTGGAKMPITEHCGLRAQMRLLGTVITDESRILCESDGGLSCLISSDVTGMVQGDLTAGFYVTF